MDQNTLVAAICRAWELWWSMKPEGPLYRVIENENGNGTTDIILYNDEGEEHDVITVEYLGIFSIGGQDVPLARVDKLHITASGEDIVAWALEHGTA